MIPLDDFLSALAVRRPVFHSEADFQHALAWQIHSALPDAEIRLEIPIRCGDEVFRVDMLVRTPLGTTAIELKYKTKLATVIHNDERYELGNHAANDHGRYDFLKDVQRIELLAQAGIVSAGFAVLVTNDHLYWEQQREDANDYAFHVGTGRVLSGDLAWRPATGKGTIAKREASLMLRGSHRCDWREFSQVQSVRYGNFRCLLLRV